jgi:GNAT superfamily N-acetyltransferase
MVPPSTYELIAQVHRVTSRFNARVRGAVASLPGNPGRVHVERFDTVWAARCDLPDAPQWMNLAAPLSNASAGVLPELLAWYGERRPMIEVTPQPDHETLARDLARRGAVQTGFLDVLRGPVVVPGDRSAVDVSVVSLSPEETMLWARTLLAGHIDEFFDHEAAGLGALVGADSVRCYLARVDGAPAAGAILAIDEGLAYLANASALPAFRNRGCHSALLAARLRDAAETGCDTVIGLAAVGSTSHRNMERSGLHTLVTLTQWTFPD